MERDMKRAVCSFALLLLITIAGQAQEVDRANQRAVHKATVEEAIAAVSRPAHGCGGMPAFGALQAYYRLNELNNYDRGFYYKYADSDRDAWKSLLERADASIYARMCAAFMLIDRDKAAREFLERQAVSDNLRHRYNAAK